MFNFNFKHLSLTLSQSSSSMHSLLHFYLDNNTKRYIIYTHFRKAMDIHDIRLF